MLTQNTAWTNVEKAIANLKRARVLSPGKMYDLPEGQLADLIRPAGHFNVKARRLRAFLKVIVEECGGSLPDLLRGETARVRERLLNINGIGPETADSMLLYAAEHHSFVIDAYTKRIFLRHGWCDEGATYHQLQDRCVSSLGQKSGPAQLDYWRDYHAQLVMVGTDHCRPRDPRCETCPLKPLLPPD